MLDHLLAQIEGQTYVFDPKTVEDYTMQGITLDEQTLLRQRLAYQLPLVDRDTGDESSVKGVI